MNRPIINDSLNFIQLVVRGLICNFHSAGQSFVRENPFVEHFECEVLVVCLEFGQGDGGRKDNMGTSFASLWFGRRRGRRWRSGIILAFRVLCCRRGIRGREWNNGDGLVGIVHEENRKKGVS